MRQVVFTDDALTIANERDTHRKQVQSKWFAYATEMRRPAQTQQTKEPSEQTRSRCQRLVAGTSRFVQRRPYPVGLLLRKSIRNGDMKQESDSRSFERLRAWTDDRKSARDLVPKTHQLFRRKHPVVHKVPVFALSSAETVNSALEILMLSTDRLQHAPDSSHLARNDRVRCIQRQVWNSMDTAPRNTATDCNSPCLAPQSSLNGFKTQFNQHSKFTGYSEPSDRLMVLVTKRTREYSVLQCTFRLNTLP